MIVKSSVQEPFNFQALEDRMAGWNWVPAPVFVFSPLSKGFDVGDDGRVLAPGQPLLQQQSRCPRSQADKKWEMCDIALYPDIYCIQISNVAH